MTVRRTMMLALTGATLAGGLALFVATTAPRLSLLQELPLVAPREARADAKAREGRFPDAVAETHATLDASPAAASAWLRLAWLETGASRALPAAAVDAIGRSYAVAPLGPDVSDWRLSFLLERWHALPPFLRNQALAEMKAMQSQRPAAFRALAQTVQNPSGRLAATMIASTPRRLSRTALARPGSGTPHTDVR